MTTAIYDLSLVIACYNEGPSLRDSVNTVIETLDHTPWSYELIFVDDCSQDGTREAINAIIESHPNTPIKKILHDKNTGRGRTVTDGIRIAEGRVAGYIDIDLEVHARYMPAHVIEINKGADISIADRVYKVQPRLYHRFLLSVGYTAFLRLMLGLDPGDSESGYKFFNRERILPLLDETENPGWFWDTEIVVRAMLKGYKIVQLPCLFIRRYDKKSTLRVFRDTTDYVVRLAKFRGVVKTLREEHR